MGVVHEESPTRSKERHMGTEDKVSNVAKDVTGKVKEGVGKVTHNERLEAEGQRDQTEADLRKAGENVKDAFK
jgi:uncharacterized protein YjbJ (UPF0337 family)